MYFPVFLLSFVPPSQLPFRYHVSKSQIFSIHYSSSNCHFLFTLHLLFTYFFPSFPLLLPFLLMLSLSLISERFPFHEYHTSSYLPHAVPSFNVSLSLLLYQYTPSFISMYLSPSPSTTSSHLLPSHLTLIT